jgi:ABC-type branched-subunit amino acid transport system ATPase component
MTEHAGGPLLAIEDLRAWYGRAQVLFGVSLEVAAGQIVGLVGRNGAGKTTLLRSIMAAGVTRSGRIALAGRDVSGLSTERLARAGVAWVPDDRRILAGLTVRQNLEMARNAAVGRGAIPVDELCRTFPMLGELLGKHGDELSGGQQQMIAIARGLATRPSLLLLDEPTEGLAPLVVRELIAVIEEIPRSFGVGVLLVEENLRAAAALCTDVCALKLGHVAYRGSFTELMNDRRKLDQILALASTSELEEIDG